MSTTFDVAIPKPNRAIYTDRDYRVPKTNYTLDSVDFILAEKDFLFQLYGKGTVLAALAVYFGALDNTHRDENSSNKDELRTGLVATMESIRTRGREQTENTIFGGENIANVIRRKYDGREPAMRDRGDNGLQQALLTHFIGFYIKGGNVQEAKH